MANNKSKREKAFSEYTNDFIVAMVRAREAIDIGYCNKWLRYANADPSKVVSARDRLDRFETQHYGAVKALQRMVREYVDQIDCSINDQELRDAFELPTDEWYAKPVAYMVKNHTTTSEVEDDEVIAFEKDIVEAGVLGRGIGSGDSIT
jgi:hypothetical protein